MEDVFVISKESGCTFFIEVNSHVVTCFYDDCIKLPKTDEEWESKVRGFIENYGFSAVGV